MPQLQRRQQPLSGQSLVLLLTCCCRPVFSAATAELSFHYKLLAANATSLPAVGGTVNAYAAPGNGNSTLPSVTAGSTTFYNARCVRGLCACEDPDNCTAELDHPLGT